MTTEADRTPAPMIVCRDVHKWYGHYHALRGVNMDVQKGEVIVIFGPSGSGKSTFIRTLNRLEEHQRGQILVDGVELSNDVRNIERVRTETGMVFQQFNLFPHLTVIQNVTLAPLWVRRWPKGQAEKVALELLERVGIPEQAQKYPGQLSGGQQQRVLLARALAMQAPVIFLDEPTTGLDAKSQDKLLTLLVELRDQKQTAILLSTHHPGSALAIADCGFIVHRTVTPVPLASLDDHHAGPITTPEHAHTHVPEHAAEHAAEHASTKTEKPA